MILKEYYFSKQKYWENAKPLCPLIMGMENEQPPLQRLPMVAGEQQVVRFSPGKRQVRFCEETEDERNLLMAELLFQKAQKRRYGRHLGDYVIIHYHHH